MGYTQAQVEGYRASMLRLLPALNATPLADHIDLHEYMAASHRSTHLDALRWPYIATRSFAVPCSEAVEALCELGPLLEVGAGTGYWSAALRLDGADIVATDHGEPSTISRYGQIIGSAGPVERLSGPEAVQRYPNRAVLMVWPCHGERWPLDTISLLPVDGRLAFIGPPEVTASPEFFSLLSRDFQLERTVEIPRFPGQEDRLDIFHRVRA